MENGSGVTSYQAKYFAYDLTREGGKGIDRLQQSLLSASVDLNPHQVEAALFALRSPISKGVMLADEVGLGKTIEAGLLMCQLWAERKRKIKAAFDKLQNELQDQIAGQREQTCRDVLENLDDEVRAHLKIDPAFAHRRHRGPHR